MTGKYKALVCLLFMLIVTTIAGAQIQKPAPATPAEDLARAKQFYAETFRTNKDRAQDGCEKAGGRLWVMVTTAQAGRPAVSISCEFR